MRLIKTHDGLFGWQKNKRTSPRWFKSEFQAQMFGAASFNFDPDDIKYFNNDFALAIREMNRTGHTIAEFGIVGSFMYTTPEVKYEW